MAEGAELHIDENDSLGKKIGVLAAILAVLLSLFTISAHRAHTETIELQNETNDLWSYYQAKRIRSYQLEMNSDLLEVISSANPEKTKLIKNYADKQTQYKKDLEELKKEAEISTQKDLIIQKKALYFDFAEGILEISLILSSLYFISHKKLFPNLGFIFGCIGTVVGVIGFML